MPKFALCLQGGGSRGTYCAGPIEVLMENDLWADFVIGTSCGGLMACNYVAKQPHRAIEQTLFMAEATTLSKLRQEQKTNSFSAQIHKKSPWLFNWRSLFYFFCFVFLLGALWMGYSLFTNSMKELFF